MLKFFCRLAAVALAFSLAACDKPMGPVAWHETGKPASLSEWALMRADGKQLVLNKGVEPYELNSPLFSDYAHKLRTVWMPAGKSGHYSEKDVFDLPVGTVISKTFYYPKGENGQVLKSISDTGAEFVNGALDLKQNRLVETRLLVHRAEGWVAMPYVWNAEQTEATLARVGDQMPMDLEGQKFTYVVPNENQCASCHMTHYNASKTLEPIGLKTRHINRDLFGENQLARLVRVGYLQGVPGLGAQELAALPRAPDWHDAKLPVEARARAYLDINCAHCHNPKGPASTTALNLEPFLAPNLHLGLCKPPVAAGKGTGNRLFGIVPGEPDASIMLYRLASTEGGEMMPELGRSTAHAEGVALIKEWVASMSGGCQAAQPQ
ncbi:MAG: hypothetical protein JO006_01850 [Paucibacter sp.]|nr:hypothetical protein [Roseateles sp.]